MLQQVSAVQTAPVTPPAVSGHVKLSIKIDVLAVPIVSSVSKSSLEGRFKVSSFQCK